MQFIDLKKQYLFLKEQIHEYIDKVLSDGQYISGEEVRELASRLASYCGVKYCLPCANGTDALTLALRCFDVKKGDAVFVPDFTFFASAEAIALEGATPIFVDVEERTFNMDAAKLEAAIQAVVRKGDLQPKAVMTVDLFGLPADYPRIKKVADAYCLPILEDSAQGFGGSIDGKKACSFGDISTTSFFPAKPLGCYGDGGAVFTEIQAYYTLLQSLAVHGKGSDKYDNVRIGYNSRLDTLQAGILIPKLNVFEDFELRKRNEIARKYTDGLSKKYKTPVVPSGFESSWAQYTLILDSGKERERLQSALKAKDIPSMVYYPIPMHKQTAFSHLTQENDLSVSTYLSERVLSIPMHPYLTDGEIDFIVETLLEA